VPLFFTDESRIDVGPHEPVLVELFCSVPRVERASYRIVRLDIYAYPKGLVLNEPTGHQTKQLRTHAGFALLMDDVDPLQFSVAGISRREMACCEADHRAFVYRHETRSRCSCLPRIQLPCQISRDAVFPIVWLTPLACATASHGGDVAGFC
jgi:hypothetical protein